MVFLREVYPRNEFERLHLVLLLIILDRRMKQISLLESFGSLLPFSDFVSDPIVVAESFNKGFLRSFSSK